MVGCSNNKLTSLTFPSNTPKMNLSCSNNQLTSLSLANRTTLMSIYCSNNKLTSLNVTGCSNLEDLYCDNNRLTSLNLQGCSSLADLNCYQNQISGSGMTTLVNSLPTRPTTNPGIFHVIYNTSEGNTLTNSQIATAKGKRWTPLKYNGSSWVEYTLQTGDVDGDGKVAISDVTALIDILLSGGTAPGSADVNGDNKVTIDDVTALIDLLLGGN